MIPISLQTMPKGFALEYHGERPCIPRGAMAEINCRTRPFWKNEKTKLRPAILPVGWSGSFIRRKRKEGAK